MIAGRARHSSVRVGSADPTLTCGGLIVGRGCGIGGMAEWVSRKPTGDFDAVVEAALAEIPEAFAPYMENVLIEVQRRPDVAMARSVGLDDPRRLFGIYIGRPITKRSVEEGAVMPDRVVIFQENLERACRTPEQLRAEIRKTVLHEVGHHFGLNEDDLDRLGYG